MPTAKNLIKAQLRRYYQTQGVGIRRREKLVKADLAAYVGHVAATHGVSAGHVRRVIPYWVVWAPNTPPCDLIERWAAMFAWHKTPEGHTYWARRFGFF